MVGVSDLISSEYELLWKKTEILKLKISLQEATYSKSNSVVSKFDPLTKSHTLHSADLKESGRLLFACLTSVSPFAVKKNVLRSLKEAQIMRVFGFFISAIAVSACDLFPVDYGFGESIYHRAEYFFRNRCFRTLNDGEFHKFGALTDFVLDGSGYYR